jgi:hypothetical protein
VIERKELLFVVGSLSDIEEMLCINDMLLLLEDGAGSSIGHLPQLHSLGHVVAVCQSSSSSSFSSSSLSSLTVAAIVFNGA